MDYEEDREQLLPSGNRRKGKGGMARRLGSILTAKKGKGNKSSTSSHASMSVVGDNSTYYNGDGEKSVALTVSSQKTVKVSNRKPEKEPATQLSKSGSGRGAWVGLKRLVGATADNSMTRIHSKSEDFDLRGKSRSTGTLWSTNPLRKRILSEDGANQQAERDVDSALSARVTSHLDLAIRGRLDGVDILSLGPASKSTIISTTTQVNATTDQNSNEHIFDPLKYSFVGKSQKKHPTELISDMIWASGGKDCPELILEGYLPGGGDRWTVKLGRKDQLHESDGEDNVRSISAKQQPSNIVEEDDDSTAELTEDGSTNLPSHMLWDHIWGNNAPPPAPTHMKSGKSSSDDEDEDVMQLAAVCSVPVDLDEDAFIIDGPEHFRSVQDVAMVPVQGRRFDAGLKVLEKLIKGLEEQGKSKFDHLQACTHHNMGIILLCQSRFDKALVRFQSAVNIRTECLSQNHPDTAVSLMRLGEAQFALEQFQDAMNSFELALSMSPTEDATRAKMLNNLGVVHFQQQNMSEALQAFTSALEIQRQWLDGQVRRESIVYDATITLGNMGKVFLELNECEVAYSVFEEACLLQTSTFRKDHDLLLTSLENLALTHIKSDEYDKALPILRGLLRSKGSKFGVDHRSYVETMGMLSFVLIREVELEEGSELLKKVVCWQEENMKVSHSSAKLTKEALATVTSMMDGNTSLWV